MKNFEVPSVGGQRANGAVKPNGVAVTSARQNGPMTRSRKA
jgi:hypothetical protein